MVNNITRSSSSTANCIHVPHEFNNELHECTPQQNPQVLDTEVRYIRGASGGKFNVGTTDISIVSTKFLEASSTGVTKAHQLLDTSTV